MPAPTDLIQTLCVGDVVQATGLRNAGRHYTVLAIGRTQGRVQLHAHLSGAKFWTFDKGYRFIEHS